MPLFPSIKDIQKILAERKHLSAARILIKPLYILLIWHSTSYEKTNPSVQKYVTQFCLDWDVSRRISMSSTPSDQK
jgi:hypothetical protein